MLDIEKAKNEFMRYTSNYDQNNPHITRKIYHSLRVVEYSKRIAENLNLTNEQIELAMLIGLLHDIARFEQRRIYGTYVDKLSIDHGDLAVEILEKDNFIRKFIETDKYDEIIKVAIKNHNKYKIDEGIEGEALLQSQIVKDADKLDIFYQMAEQFNRDIEKIEKSDITEDYFNQFKSRKCICRNAHETELDHLVLVVSFIFDMHFNYSLQIVKDENFLEKIFKRFDLKNEKTKNKIKEILKIANEFLLKNEVNH